MKKIFALSSLIFCACAFADTVYLGSDGKFYDAVSGGTEVTRADTDTVGFQTGVTEWNLTGTTKVASLDGATAKGVSINVGTNQLTFSDVLFANTESTSAVTFNGQKGVIFSTYGFSTSQTISPSVTYNITTAQTSNLGIQGQRGSKYMTVNFTLGKNAVYSNGRFSVGLGESNFKLTLEEGAKYTHTATTANGNWGTNIVLDAKKDSIIDIACGLQIARKTGEGNESTLDGTLVVRSDNAYSLKISGNNNFTFGTNAKVYQLKGDGTHAVDFSNGSFTSNAGKSSLLFAQNLNFGTTTLTLNTSDAFVTGLSTIELNSDYTLKTDITKTQGDSNFTITAGNKLTLILGAEQHFGGFTMGSTASKLDITLAGNAIDLGTITGLGTDALIIKDFANGLVISDTEIGLDSINAYLSGSSAELTDLEWRENGEGYMLYSASAPSVPEPAEWAVILGAIALSFVAYRRK